MDGKTSREIMLAKLNSKQPVANRLRSILRRVIPFIYIYFLKKGSEGRSIFGRLSLCSGTVLNTPLSSELASLIISKPCEVAREVFEE